MPGTEFLILVPAMSLIIHCNNLQVVDGLLFATNVAHATLSWTGCATLQGGKTSPGCKPSEPWEAKAIIKPILHNGEIYLLFSPLEAGKNLAVVKFNEEACALPSENPVRTSFVMECYKGVLVLDDCKVAKVTHTLKFAPKALFGGDTLTWGLNPMEVHGEFEFFMLGADFNKTWNALI